MPSNPTRRRFIATSLVASSVMPINDVLAFSDIEKIRLMWRREHLQSEIGKLDRQWALAYAKLPSWCRAGYKFRDEQGRMFGPTVGWPDAGSDAIRLASGEFLVRPSVQDIFELRQTDQASMIYNESEKLFGNRLKAIFSRVRERRRLETAAELPRSSAWLPLEIELEAIE